MKILITGAAGFIGYHVCRRLLEDGYTVTGLDVMNSYYDTSLKESRLSKLKSYKEFSFYKMDLSETDQVLSFCAEKRFEYIIHLAAQAGVRYSLENPKAYIDSNIEGFFSILEACRLVPVKHLIYASSSSVYGNNTKVPFSETDRVDTPVSMYAATKRSNELMAYTYSQLYGIPATGLRFFTVYGPWGRPDMAYYSFTKAIIEGTPIEVYNHGQLQRDFTFIDDIVEGIIGLIDLPPQGHALYNIGNNHPVSLGKFIETLETLIGKKAVKIMKPMQQGDVVSTYADISALHKRTGYVPRTGISEGLKEFIDWYREYHAT